MSVTWYLGPLGDLRALPCPEPGVEMPTVRYGGVFQGLSGARTMDFTGTRAQFKLAWKYLDQSEWAWVEALYLRRIPGPLALLHPLRKNRLSPQATALRPDTASNLGVRLSGGSYVYEYDWPTAAGAGSRSLRWTPTVVGQYVAFDAKRPTAAMAGEALTGSVYMKRAASGTVNVLFEFYNRAGTLLSSSTPTAASLTTSWQRFSNTATAPAGTAMALLKAVTVGGIVGTWVAAPQVELGSSATAFEDGGGAPRVLIDQLESTSPRYPVQDITMTLLEA